MSEQISKITITTSNKKFTIRGDSQDVLNSILSQIVKINNTIVTIQEDIVNIQGDITNIKSILEKYSDRITVAEQNLTQLQSQVALNSTDIDYIKSSYVKRSGDNMYGNLAIRNSGDTPVNSGLSIGSKSDSDTSTIKFSKYHTETSQEQDEDTGEISITTNYVEDYSWRLGQYAKDAINLKYNDNPSSGNTLLNVWNNVLTINPSGFHTIIPHYADGGIYGDTYRHISSNSSSSEYITIGVLPIPLTGCSRVSLDIYGAGNRSDLNTIATYIRVSCKISSSGSIEGYSLVESLKDDTLKVQYKKTSSTEFTIYLIKTSNTQLSGISVNYLESSEGFQDKLSVSNIMISGSVTNVSSFKEIHGKFSSQGFSFYNYETSQFNKVSLLNNNLDISSLTCTIGTLLVNGTSILKGATTLNSTLNVTGIGTFSNDVNLSKNLSVTGTSTLTGKVSAKGALDVTGATTLNSTLNVTGITYLEKDLYATGGGMYLASKGVIGWADSPAKLTQYSFSGNSYSATKLENSITLSLTGDVSAATTSDFSKDITLLVDIPEISVEDLQILWDTANV